MSNWDKKFMGLAEHIAKWSKDPSTKVGAVIVDSRHKVTGLGYNGFPRGVDDTVAGRYVTEDRYAWTEHAELNALHNADASVVGCTMYSTLYPCAGCARAIIQNGISELVTREVPDIYWNNPTWKFDIAKQMLAEAGVLVRFI